MGNPTAFFMVHYAKLIIKLAGLQLILPNFQ